MGRASRWLKALWTGGSKKTRMHTAHNEGEPKNDRSLARSFRDEDIHATTNPKKVAAVAAASAAVAHAAVATAQAAVAVVKLAGSGRHPGRLTEDSAAVKIQSAFRGCLARRALKALKGLVKLQALVRGHIVRKHAAETFRCMQALLRVQARVRTCRHRHLIPSTPSHTIRVNATQMERSSISQRAATRAADGVVIDSNMLQSPSWKWLDQWMEQRYWDTQGNLSGRAGSVLSPSDEADVKIVEIDTGIRPQSNPRWSHSQYFPPSPSKLSNSGVADSCDGSIFFSASSRHGSVRRGQFSPITSECSGSLGSGYIGHPNYMAYTESSRAKARPNSTPKQRPENGQSPTPATRATTANGYCSSSPLSHGSPSVMARHIDYYKGFDRRGMPVV